MRAALIASFCVLSAVSCAQAAPAPTRAPPAWAALGAGPGAIVISQSQRKLFLIEPDGAALAYPIAVGKAGKAWLGWAHVTGKYVEPAWAPPAEVKHDVPGIPDVIPGGAPNNPMGARALTLDREEIAIHGTTRTMRRSIGTAASYGCIRMLNEDVIDLYGRVGVGAPVLAVR